MMMYLILTTLIGFCIIDFKGKVSYKLLIVLMFFIMAYVTTNVDMPAYKMMYNSINSFRDLNVTDPAFSLLMLLGKRLNMSYYSFVKMITIIGLVLISYVFNKYSKGPAFVLALYFIFTFSAETVQLRAFLAETILYILLIKIIKSDFFDVKHFILTLMLATLFHSTSIFFALLIFIYIIKDRKKLFLVVVSSSILIPYLNTILAFLPIPMLNTKLQYYLSEQREGVSIGAVIYIVLYLCIILYLLYVEKKEMCEKWAQMISRMIKIHYIGLISCILIISYSSNFYRLTRTIIVVDFLFLVNYWLATQRINKRNIVLLSGGVMIFFIVYESITKTWATIIANNSVLNWLL